MSVLTVADADCEKRPRKLALAAIALALVTLPAIELVRQHRTPQLPTYGTLAAFSLTDQDGARFDSAQLAGQVWIADFIFTRCTFICPRLTADMAKVQTHLRNRGLDTRIVSFSVDPENDTPARLKAYAQQFGAKPGWSFLTGPEKAIERTVVDGFKTAMSRGDVGDFDVVHGAKFVLVDTHARIRGYYDSTDANDLARLVADAESLK